MSIHFPALVAAIPVILALMFVVGSRWPATRAMPPVWPAAILYAIVVWDLPIGYVATLTIQGIIITISIYMMHLTNMLSQHGDRLRVRYAVEIYAQTLIKTGNISEIREVVPSPDL